jgi:hypothetical protein
MFIVFYGNADHHLQTGFIIHKGMKSVEMVEFVNHRMLYIMLRSCWSDVIFLNMHAPNEDESNDLKDKFYEELECIFSPQSTI